MRGGLGSGLAVGVQLKRGVLIAGVEPEVARGVARGCRDMLSDVEQVANRSELSTEQVTPVLEALTDAGFLSQVLSPDDRFHDGDYIPRFDTWPRWKTTISGNALAMASFLKPISRAKAEALMDGVLERAAQYNQDPGKVYVITELRVFGSYVTNAATLGDLDLALAFTDRDPHGDRALAHAEYAKASGRTFRTLMEELAWPTRELVQFLRNRSPYINVHGEDISRFTSQWMVVYPPDSVRGT